MGAGVYKKIKVFQKLFVYYFSNNLLFKLNYFVYFFVEWLNLLPLKGCM